MMHRSSSAERIRRSMAGAGIVLCLLLGTGCESGARLLRETPITGTWGDMYRHRPTGEILGVELRIVETAVGLQGALQVGRGEDFGGLSPMAVVDVVLEGDSVRFTVPDTHPWAGRFEGTRQRDAIVGQFKLLDGREEFVVLKRGDSFWD